MSTCRDAFGERRGSTPHVEDRAPDANVPGHQSLDETAASDKPEVRVLHLAEARRAVSAERGWGGRWHRTGLHRGDLSFRDVCPLSILFTEPFTDVSHD